MGRKKLPAIDTKEKQPPVEVTLPEEEKPDVTMLPSIFDQIESDMETGQPTGEETPSAISKLEGPSDLSWLKDKDLVGLVQIPFDTAAVITRYTGWILTTEQRETLASAWRNPLVRILSRYPNADLYFALTITLGIAGEKYVEYQNFSAGTRKSTISSGSTGNERVGKDKLT